MQTKQIIDQIKDAGYQVKITHHRYLNGILFPNSEIKILTKGLKILRERLGEFPGYFDISGRGGLTTVEAIKGDQSYLAKADCSVSDNFVYKKASRLALYRLLKVLPDESLVSLREEMKKAFVTYRTQYKVDGKWVDSLSSQDPNRPPFTSREIEEFV